MKYFSLICKQNKATDNIYNRKGAILTPKKDRKMKRLKIVFGLLFCTVLCHAEDYTNLSFEKTDGSVVSVSVDNLSMTFSGGKLLLDNGAAAT